MTLVLPQHLNQSISNNRLSGQFLSLLYFIEISVFKANIDPDLTLHSAASDLGLHCFANYPLRAIPTEMGKVL